MLLTVVLLTFYCDFIVTVCSCYEYECFDVVCTSYIHDYIRKFVSLLDSWRSKYYAYEFVSAIDKVDEIFTELRACLFHALIVNESPDIAVHKMLVLFLSIVLPIHWFIKQCYLESSN